MTSWCCCDSNPCPADAGTNPRPTAAGGAKEEIYRGRGPSGRGTLLVSRGAKRQSIPCSAGSPGGRKILIGDPGWKLPA